MMCERAKLLVFRADRVLVSTRRGQGVVWGLACFAGPVLAVALVGCYPPVAYRWRRL